ncbi:MAG: MobF family relaxase [Dermatophilaceae bacterium]
MHGGLKVYRGSPSAARSYVEAGRARADDYYLAEGTGIAGRYIASPEGVRAGGTLTGDGYEAWVGGCDPDTGAPKGRVRTDAAAVRFVEVVVNGPKSWSLAAALHPDIAQAYDGAQDAAAVQIIGWLAEHSTTRVGPRGRQVQVPVQQIEAAVVRHYTSRAGDPHRHLHLQVNARVFAEGKWRGLHTVGVRDSLDAINGIGHGAVMTDPDFRAALASHGFHVDPQSGEIVELAAFAGPFSARAAQIGRNMDRYEADWRAANPGAEPGPKLRQSWDALAWAQARPDKVIPKDGAELTKAWVQELYGLGYREPEMASNASRVLADAGPKVGQLDRSAAVQTVLSRLGARRSAWNGADIRGEVEQLIARTGLVATAAVRVELAEDLTARTLAACVPLVVDRDGTARAVPEHLRALTSPQVLAVEGELVTRLASRAAHTPASPDRLAQHVAGGIRAAQELDCAQQAVAAALAGTAPLTLVEGAAGAGKTTTLAAARQMLERQGHRLVVVTPTLKAARVAAGQTGATAYSAAWLAHQHGYRWDTHGTWTRLRAGQSDPRTGATYPGPAPGAVLRPGDLLLVDEAGMLDQDSARALLVIADEHHTRLALVGDRHQLPAVGRGGVLDLAARWANPESCLALETVHRFVDPDYAELSLAMRTSQHPAGVFDTLLARGQIRLHPSEAERTRALAQIGAQHPWAGASGEPVLVIAETREQVAALNGTIRDQLVATGRLKDSGAVTTASGERIGVGDRVATRRNEPTLDVANRDTWTVTRIGPDGALALDGGRGERHLPADYVQDHLELAYSTTVYGAQGHTVAHAHLLVGEHTGAAAAYVGMTRGRETNIAHLVAGNVKDARAQWMATFARDRADLGPAHAARLAAAEAATYATGRPLEAVLVDLRRAWTLQADLTAHIAQGTSIRDELARIVPLRAQSDPQIDQLRSTEAQARVDSDHARARLRGTEAAITTATSDLTRNLHDSWNQAYPNASGAAETIRAGTGRFGRGRAEVNAARANLTSWTRAWQPILTEVTGLPAGALLDPDQLATRIPYNGTSALHAAIGRYAEHAAGQAHPELAATRRAVQVADQHLRNARDARTAAEDARTHHFDELGLGYLAYTDRPAQQLAAGENNLNKLTRQLNQTQERISALGREPAIRTLPVGRLQTEQDTCVSDHEHEKDARAQALWAARNARRPSHEHEHHHDLHRSGADHGISR